MRLLEFLKDLLPTPQSQKKAQWIGLALPACYVLLRSLRPLLPAMPEAGWVLVQAVVLLCIGLIGTLVVLLSLVASVKSLQAELAKLEQKVQVENQLQLAERLSKLQ